MSELLEEVCAYMQVSGRVPLRFIPALVARLAELEANGGAIRPTVSVDHSKPVGVGKKRIPVSIL